MKTIRPFPTVAGLAAAFVLGLAIGRFGLSPDEPRPGRPPSADQARSVAAASGIAPSLTAATGLEASPFFAGIPDVRQSTGFSCGAAALQAVLAYWGTSEREDRLIERLKSTPEEGTHPEDILRVAREFGLRAEMREGLALADLEAALAGGTTVIVDLQAWRDSPAGAWSELWEDGHYVVLLGLDHRRVYFEDPSLLGSRGFIPVAEFLDRWHDYEGPAPLDETDRRYVRMAIFIRGTAAAPPPRLEKIE